MYNIICFFIRNLLSYFRYLAKEVKCFTLFSTHFHEITKIAESLDCVQNLHVTALATEEAIIPLYQVKEGVCDKSYGVLCARTVEFPEEVIKVWTKRYFYFYLVTSIHKFQVAEDHQKELEDYEGMKYIKTYDVSLKRKIVDVSIVVTAGQG